MFKYLWLIALITVYLIWAARSVIDIISTLAELRSDEDPAVRKNFWERFFWNVKESSLWCVGLTIAVLITASFVSWTQSLI